MKNKINTVKKFTYGAVTALTTTLVMSTPVFAQAANPTAEINALVERIITIATQVGSGLMILFIVRNAFELMQDGDNPSNRGKLARNVFLLVMAAILLFKPDFVLNAIKYIANV